MFWACRSGFLSSFICFSGKTMSNRSQQVPTERKYQRKKFPTPPPKFPIPISIPANDATKTQLRSDVKSVLRRLVSNWFMAGWLAGTFEMTSWARDPAGFELIRVGLPQKPELPKNATYRFTLRGLIAPLAAFPGKPEAELYTGEMQQGSACEPWDIACSRVTSSGLEE